MTPLIVICTVGILVATPYGQNHLNVELKGVEVREVATDKSLVDFSGDIAAKRIAIIGPTVVIMNMNLCRYLPEDVAKFNNISSEMTAKELQKFQEYSKVGHR